MSDARTATGFDRLPWLEDEPERPPESARSRFTGWLVAAALILAGAAAYWFATRTADQPPTPAVSRRAAPPSTTVPVPPPEVTQPQVEPVRVPEVEPVPVPAVSLPAPATSPRRTSRRRHAVAVHRNSTPLSVKESEKPASAPASAPTRSGYPALWPSRMSQGASGRLVQIGAFGTRYQAKRGWWAMVRAYPSLKRLPTVVNDARNSRGRRFYRLQIGTTSQAHSEILCQKMERIRFSCAVVGLPGERKAVER